MTPTPQTILPHPPIACVFALLSLLLLPTPLRADDIRLGDIWITDVHITYLRGDRLGYLTVGGVDVTKSVTDVQGVRFSDHPQYAEALAALDAGDAKRAVTLLQPIASRARVDWVKAFAGAALWRAQAAQGDAAAAVKTYVDLAAADVDAFFLTDPPVALVAAAADDVKRKAADLIRPALSKRAEPVRDNLQSLLDAAAIVEAVPQTVEAPAPVAAAPDSAAEPPPPVVVLPVKMTESEATKLLLAGKFTEARALLDTELEQEGNMAVELYLLGIAQLYEADAAGDPGGCMDAGLSFMRVIVYFPRSNFAGRNLVGGSLLELAYIHDKLGRTEKATELYARAAAEISESADPNLFQRLTTLRAARP